MEKENRIKITNIFWKRTYLFIEYEASKNINLSLVKLKNQKPIKQHVLETKQIEKNKYRSKINITIAEGRENLENGKWHFFCNNENNLPFISNIVLENLENYSRVFRYNNKTNAYVISFEISSKTPIVLSLIIDYMKINKHPKKKTVKDILEQNIKFRKKIKGCLVLIYKKTLNIYYQILSTIIIKRKKRILFMSQNMDHIRDNMETVNNRIIERNLNEKYKLSYDFTNIYDGKTRIFYWIKIVTKIALSDYIFVDDYVPVFAFLKLKKKNILTQLWHAGFGFKLVGYSRFGIAGSPHPYESCHRKYTYGIIGNEKLKEIYSEVWGIEKKALLPTGMPRLENFLDENYINDTTQKFKKNYPELSKKRIITFATTYRGLSQKEAYYDYTKIDFDSLYKVCKETNSAVIFSRHHFLTEKVPIPEKYKNLILDISDYKLNDLFYSTDILITDYSSCFYDFLLLKKPILFYVYDKDFYSATRGVHRPIEKVAPGKICLTFEEIIEALKKETIDNTKKVDFLTDNCITNKKRASDQIIDYILLGKGRD